jgi:hypothetical protein
MGSWPAMPARIPGASLMARPWRIRSNRGPVIARTSSSPRTMVKPPVAVNTVGANPDVLAYDPGLERLCIAAERGSRVSES